MEQTTISTQTGLEDQSEDDQDKRLKFTFDGKGKEDAVDTLNRFLKDCNNKSFGRKITVSDVIARGLRKLDQKDLKLLQEQSMGLKDSLRHKYKEEKGVEATEDEFVRWLLEDYRTQKDKKKIN
jgi:mRNA-degrading endonuclease RelE of RelBE toxin-antitoxin system